MSEVSIIRAESGGPEPLAQAASLFREYASSLPFSLCFQGFEAELAALPGRYAAPDGRILLAIDRATAQAGGCVALRRIDRCAWDPDGARVCEMKRMYVKPAWRGRGIGRLLADRLLEEARAIGYTLMKLDSESDFVAATGLYRSMGFTEIPRYNDDPLPNTIWMGLAL